MTGHRILPIAVAGGRATEDCSGAEPFALMVLGDSMAPEFRDGEIIVVEPEGLARAGSFVVAQVDGDWMLRELARAGEGWELRALDPYTSGSLHRI